MTQTKTKAKQAPTQSEILATIRAQFKDMKVDNTRLTMIEEQIKDLLEETEAVVGIDLDRETEAAERGQTIKYSEMEVISIIGPTGSTKSTSLERIVERWNKARPGEMPIVMVTYSGVYPFREATPGSDPRSVQRSSSRRRAKVDGELFAHAGDRGDPADSPLEEDLRRRPARSK